MTFDPKKFNEIFEDMRGRTSVITDFEVGSVARTLYESFAYEIALLYEKMRLVYLSAYVDTAQGQQLDNVVSVLGIKRGEPDFAVGTVTFGRDTGKEDILIPLGTLVSTEEAPGSAKKVYQTTEAKTLAKDRTGIEVKVQAVLRGEEQVAAAETIAVMPRPLPGVKAVVNKQATGFTGKRRETDEELKERAKNSLISSGKATMVSLENALLSMPGVRDVRVREPFHLAQGNLLFTRKTGTGDVTIPYKTQLTASRNGVKKEFETTERAVLAAGSTTIKVAARSRLEGRVGELTETSGVTWNITSGGLETLAAANDEPLLLGQFGVTEIFVDGPDLADAEEAKRIRDEIDRVRAAGVFVLLKEATPVSIDGVFRIELNPALKLSPEERGKYEDAVRNAIVQVLADLKMGESLLFSKLIRNVLSLEGIDNLDDFRMAAITGPAGAERETPYAFADKRIDIEESERFHPRYLCVASEIKPLLVNIQFKATGLSNSKLDATRAALGNYIAGLKTGDTVEKVKVLNAIVSVSGIGLEAATLRFLPESWCERILFRGDDVATTFVEQPVLGDVFGYNSLLDITGALKLTLPVGMKGAEKQAVQDAVRAGIESYLENLKAEADVVFEDLTTLANKVEGVLAATVDPDDFRAEINNIEQPGKVTKKKIEVSPFEKAGLRYFCITGDVETVLVNVTSISLKVLAPQSPAPALTADLTIAVKNAINNAANGFVPGDNLKYARLKQSLEGLVPGLEYVVTALTLNASSGCDGRIQQTDLNTAKDVHVRTVEMAVIVPIAESTVSVATS